MGSHETNDWTREDVGMIGLFVIVALGLYGALAFRLALGGYPDYYNLAFDFDPVRTVDALASTPPDFLNFKHPLLVLLRPLAWPLLAVGLTAKQSVSLIMAAVGAADIALCYVFLRHIPVERWIAAALTLLFMVSGTQLFASIITETYGFAGFSVILTWVVAQARLADPARFRRVRYAAGLVTLGSTITNVVQSFIAEMMVAWRWEGFVRAIRRCFVFGVILGVLFTILGVAVWFNTLGEELRDPILALKHIWWLQTKGPRAGAGEVLLTFFTFSFVSPNYSWVMLPEGINMRDFREYAFPFPGQIAAPLWLAFCAAGTVAGLCHRRYRVLALALAVALLLNLLFHLDFQFRGSLYLYGAHMHFLIFALSAGLAPWLRLSRTSGKAYVAIVLLLVVLVGADNLPIARAFVADFDTVRVNCVAPCTDTVGQ